MRIVAENDREADLLARRLPAICHLLGLEPTTNLQGHRLPELLALEVAAVDLERCLHQSSGGGSTSMAMGMPKPPTKGTTAT